MTPLTHATYTQNRPDCPICQGAEAGDYFLVHGRHAFHRDCLTIWLQRNPTCPVCRENLAGRVQLNPQIDRARFEAATGRHFSHLQNFPDPRARALILGTRNPIRAFIMTEWLNILFKLTDDQSEATIQAVHQMLTASSNRELMRRLDAHTQGGPFNALTVRDQERIRNIARVTLPDVVLRHLRETLAEGRIDRDWVTEMMQVLEQCPYSVNQRELLERALCFAARHAEEFGPGSFGRRAFIEETRGVTPQMRCDAIQAVVSTLSSRY